jgi:hypothetical protein
MSKEPKLEWVELYICLSTLLMVFRLTKARKGSLRATVIHSLCSERRNERCVFYVQRKVFRLVRRIAKSDFYLRHVSLAVFLSVRSHGTTRLVMRFDI